MRNLFTVEKEIQFDAGHRVPNHKSKCRNPHGHRYRIVVGVVGELQEEGSSEGMVIDFGDIKRCLELFVEDKYDHGFIVYLKDEGMMQALEHLEEITDETFKIVSVNFVPTAENLAKAIYDDLVTAINGLAYVKCYETPTSVAIYPVQRVGTVVLDETQ